MRLAVRRLLAVLALFLTVPGALPSNPAAAETIQLKKHAGGGYLIPGRINDAVTVTFVLDTGASDVSIPENVARDLEQAGFVEQPAGAFLMLRRDVWENLGGFDEQFYPVWFEDVDFCRRALDAGYQIQYEPAAVAFHEGGHSVGLLPNGRKALYWCVSLLKYAGKHFTPGQFRGICAGVVLSSVPRMFAGMIAERSFSPLSVYFKIMRFAGACLLSPRHVKSGPVGTAHVRKIS